MTVFGFEHRWVRLDPSLEKGMVFSPPSHSGKKEIAFLPAYDAGRWLPTFREDAKKVATCIPFLVPGQESNGYLGFAGGLGQRNGIEEVLASYRRST